MKVAFYGNNLNQGYLFVESLNRAGIEAKLFSIKYPSGQEHHDWWTDGKLNQKLVRLIDNQGFNVGMCRSLTSNPEISRLYNEVREYNTIVLTEDGPGLFSELTGVKKVFFSLGSDLQIYPFMARVYYPWKKTISTLTTLFFRAILRNDQRSYLALYVQNLFFGLRLQFRQRRGIRQCAAIVCLGHQEMLLRELNVDPGKIHYLPLFPMNAKWLSEFDREEVAYLEDHYSGVDIVFLHPTRQFYLPENNDVFLKDNDKLLYAYSSFIKTAAKKTRLLLLRKGRERDIENSDRMIDQLGLKDHIGWISELPNKKLRSYYALKKVVVCDQFGPNIAILGNIGRETTFYGRPLITAFADWNVKTFGQDLPPNVFPAQTSDHILAAMKKIEVMSEVEIEKMGQATRDWFYRNLESDNAMPRFIQLLSDS